MTPAERLCRVAESDSTFRRVGPNWVGKCLICNGPLAFDASTGEGATLEHIRARSRGGGEELVNLGIVHGRCNWEKGVRWDPKKRRSADDYDALVTRLLNRRRERLRNLGEQSAQGLQEPRDRDQPRLKKGRPGKPR
jgi:hypothetical protein